MHSFLFKELSGLDTSMVTRTIDDVPDSLHLIRVVLSDEVMQMRHEDDEDLRCCVRLSASIIYSTIRVNTSNEIDFWCKLLDRHPIGVVAAAPLPPGEAHVGQPALVDRDEDRTSSHLSKNYFRTLLSQY